MKQIGVVDKPGSEPHKKHEGPVPIAGGMVILLSTMMLVGAQGILQTSPIWQILRPSLIVFIFGLWDDVKGVSVSVKLFGQILGSIFLIISGVQVQLFDANLNWLNWALTLFWMVGITNAFNFVDSMDGLASGIAGIASVFLFL